MRELLDMCDWGWQTIYAIWYKTPGRCWPDVGQMSALSSQSLPNTACSLCWEIIKNTNRFLYFRKSWPFSLPHAQFWLRTHWWKAGLSRLLHSPSLVAIELPAGHDARLPIGWHHPFVIGIAQCPIALWVHVTNGNSNCFKTPVTVPLHRPNGRQQQGHCEWV